MPLIKTRILYVNVKPAVPGTTLHAHDRDLPGRYGVNVDADLADPQAASAALDGFHDNIAVEELDDFIFTVTDTNGTFIPEDPIHESYSLRHRVAAIWRIED